MYIIYTMYNVHYIYNELVKDFCFVLFIDKHKI